MPSTLKGRNVSVNGRRTSMRLEPAFWTALQDIALRERTTINELCKRIDALRHNTPRTTRVRVFILSYFLCAEAEPTARDLLDRALERTAMPGAMEIGGPPSEHRRPS